MLFIVSLGYANDYNGGDDGIVMLMMMIIIVIMIVVIVVVFISIISCIERTLLRT